MSDTRLIRTYLATSQLEAEGQFAQDALVLAGSGYVPDTQAVSEGLARAVTDAWETPSALLADALAVGIANQTSARDWWTLTVAYRLATEGVVSPIRAETIMRDVQAAAEARLAAHLAHGVDESEPSDPRPRPLASLRRRLGAFAGAASLASLAIAGAALGGVVSGPPSVPATPPGASLAPGAIASAQPIPAPSALAPVGNNFELAISGGLARSLAGYAANPCAWTSVGQDNYQLTAILMSGITILPTAAPEPWSLELRPADPMSTRLTFAPYTDGLFVPDPAGSRRMVTLDPATLVVTLDLDLVNNLGAKARLGGRIACQRP